MAQVPYQPYSTVDPSGGGGERVSVQAPGAAFGTNIGQALQGLGSSVEQVGGELFTRAMALQDLRNETDAREAQTAYAQEASLLHADYGAKEGQAAADGLKGYIKAQGDLRQKYRDSLKTEYAQRYYDRDTLPFMQRNIFSAAGHAADENKRNVIGAAQAQKDISAKTFVNPKDEDEYQQKLESATEADATIIHARGLTPDSPQAQALNLQTTSTLRLQQIGQVAHDDPQVALGMLDRYKEQLTQGDYEKALLVARAQNRSIGSATLANSIYSQDKTAGQMEEEVKAASPKLAHGDPMFEKDALAALKSKITTDRYITSQDTNTAIQKVNEVIMSSNVLNMQQLRAQPGMAAVIDSMPPAEQAKIPSRINSWQSSSNQRGQQENFTALTGLYYNDREAFLDADFTKYNLSQDQQRNLMAKRAEALKKPADDPMLNRAMGWMRQGRAAELRALGVYFRPTEGSDATSYDHYTGALQAGIDAWREKHGQAPGFKDIVDEIGPAAIHQRVAPGTFGMLFGGTKRAAFDQDMDTVKKWADEKGLVGEITARGGAEPTDEELYRAFLRSQFIELYSKSGGAGGGPTVPQSK